ncbi:MAG: recombinase family protein [Bacteroidetes bacterium]|nr:recombinase family protein [Bacteroidota bacterium]
MEKKWSGGGIPYGYKFNSKDSSLILESAEVQVFNIIIEMILNNVGTSVIAQELNKMGYLSRTGKPWINTVVAVLLNPKRLKFYSGYDSEGNRGNWEALLEEQTVKTILEIRNPKDKGTKLADREQYLLSNLNVLKCGYCHSTVKTSVTKKSKSVKVLYYICCKRQQSGKDLCKDSKLIRHEKINNKVISDLSNVLKRDLNKFNSRHLKYVANLQRLDDIKLLENSLAILKNSTISDLEAATKFKSELLPEFKELVERFEQQSPFPEIIEQKELGVNIIEQRNTIQKYIDEILLYRDHFTIQYRMPIDNEFTFIKEFAYE